MADAAIRRRLPVIALARSDHERLTNLSDLLAERDPATADWLATELDRARVVADHRLPEGTVRMGSLVRFRMNGEERQVRLVYPGEADIEAGRISVLTPVGTALIGLKAGQSIDWAGSDGRARHIEVLAVEHSETVTAA